MKKTTVLIADDDQNIRQILCKAMEKLDAEIYEAEDGIHAIQLLSEHKTDILIADHKMPGMTGLELLSEVKKKYPEITRLLITGYMEADVFKEAINIGEIYKIITKPFRLLEVSDILKDALDFHHSKILNRDFIDKLEKEVKLFFQSFFNSGQAVIITDNSATIQYVNQAFVDLYGYDLSEVISTELHSIQIEDESEISRIFQALEENETDYWTGESFAIHKDGSHIPVINTAIPLRDHDGVITNVLFMASDLTNRLKLENKLRKSERKYRRIIQNAAEGIFQANFDNRFLMANPSFRALFQFDSLKQLKTDFKFEDIFSDPEDAASILEILRREKWLTNAEYRMKRQKGEEFTGSINLRRVRSKSKRPMYIQGFVRDVSAEKQMRELRERMQRLEALGQLSAGLAHEIKNPIASLQLNMQFLQRKYKNDEFFQENVKEVFEAINRVEKIMEQTLQFAGKKQPKLALESALNLIRRSIELIEMEFVENNTDIVLEPQNDFPELMLDKDQFIQVMVNLIKNAIQAIKGTGKISIDCSVVRINNLETAQIDVTDSGPGIPEEDSIKIFNPFFTTKSNGVGLGLSIIQKIMDLHNGSISFKSRISEGTTFTLLFPINQD